MERLLRGAVAPISVTVTAAGVPVDADAPPVIVVTRDTGETLVTGAAVHGDQTGEYVFILDAAQTGEVDVLEATWSASIDGAAAIFTTSHEVVGGFLTTVEAIEEALPGRMAKTPSTEDVEAARTLAEDWLEDECSVAFRPRYGHDKLDGNGADVLLLSRPQVLSVRSVSVAGEAVDAPTFYPSGELRGSGVWADGFQNVDVVYEHGFPRAPSQVARAATMLARYFLVPMVTDYDGRATSISTDTAHYTLITPGQREAITAIPEVNVVMELFDFPSVA